MMETKTDCDFLSLIQDSEADGNMDQCLNWVKKLDCIPTPDEYMYHIILNYLTVMGYHEAASQFTQESGTIPEIPLNILQLRKSVRQEILVNCIETAMDNLNKIEPEILRKNPAIRFRLRQQQFLDIIKEENDKENLKFVQTHLSPCVHEEPGLFPLLEDVMTVVAFPHTEQVSSWTSQDTMERRELLASTVDDVILDYFNLSKEPLLNDIIKNLLYTQQQWLESGTMDVHSFPLLMDPCTCLFISRKKSSGLMLDETAPSIIRETEYDSDNISRDNRIVHSTHCNTTRLPSSRRRRTIMTLSCRRTSVMPSTTTRAISENDRVSLGHQATSTCERQAGSSDSSQESLAVPPA